MTASLGIFLNVRDIQASLAFYKALGFKVVSRHKDKDGDLAWADLEMGSAELGLGAIDSNDDPGFQEWVATPLGAGVVVYLTVPDVDKAFAKAKKAGALVESEPTDRSYGRTAMVNDLDGYTITLFGEAPARKPNARKPAKVAKKPKAKKAKAPVKRRR